MPVEGCYGATRESNRPKASDSWDALERLNDTVCVSIGEVRAPDDPDQPEPDLVLDVAELIWEPIAD